MIGVLVTLALVQTPVMAGGLRGIVLNSSDQAVDAARVELSGGPQGTLVTRTDAQGQFVFPEVPAGRYSVSVKKEGYVRQEYGQQGSGDSGSLIEIASGSQMQGLVFRLQSAATITGIVRNEFGVPIANILVQALRRTYGIRGNPTTALFSNALTDDLGVYRLYWVDPGDYYVAATYLPQLPTPVNANEDTPRAVYAPTYYPGTSDPADARLVRLKSAEIAATIDFRLQRSPAVKISGTVYSIVSRSAVPATVILTSHAESGSTARYQVRTDQNGVFEMRGVNPGSYVLSASTLSGDGEMGFTTVKLFDNDYSRADVIVGPGVTVGARLLGNAAPDAVFRGTQVSLIPLDAFVPAPAAASIQQNGVLMFSRVQPGEYALNVSGLPGDAYVSAAFSNGRDVLSEAIQIGYENATTLEIQLAFDGGQIAGAVANQTGQPSRGTVVLVPETARRARPDQYRIVSSDPEGAFIVRGIPPGRYKLFAWDRVEPNAYLNADFMMNYEHLGTPVELAPGQRATARIGVIVDREEIR